MVTAMIAFPVLVTATAVGTLVAILQAATQIQEQTLTALPKIISVMAIVAMFGPAGMMLCANLMRHAVEMIRHLVAS